MGKPTCLRCVACRKEFSPGELEYHCPDCGPSGTLDVLYRYPDLGGDFRPETLARSPHSDVWRYGPLLPVDTGRPPAIPVGPTPLYQAETLGAHVGLPGLLIKDDGRNPTASLKDRASVVGVARALERGEKVICAASTGNAASSLAGLAAAAGIPAVIFVPETAPRAKVAQLLLFGAQVVAVQGSYDRAWELCYQASQRWGWYNRSCSVNPYLLEGKKTVGFEAVEQMGWQVPDAVFVGVGDGDIVSAAFKAYLELNLLGLITRLPRFFGVQAEGAAPLAALWSSGEWKRGGELQPVETHTLADSIAVGSPRNWRKALRAVDESKGAFVTVSDARILESMRLLASRAGVFAEPAGAAGFAGLLAAREQGLVERDARVLCLVTGNGLKDVDAAMKAAGREPLKVPADLGAVEDLVEQGRLGELAR